MLMDLVGHVCIEKKFPEKPGLRLRLTEVRNTYLIPGCNYPTVTDIFMLTLPNLTVPYIDIVAATTKG